jgi:hypothetical protein
VGSTDRNVSLVSDLSANAALVVVQTRFMVHTVAPEAR